MWCSSLRRAFSPTATLPDGCGGARARSSPLAALIRARAPNGARTYCNWRNYYYYYYYYYFCGKTKGFLRPWTFSTPHQTLHKNQSRWKIWYFIVFATGRGPTAPQRPLEVVKNSCKISGLTDSHEIWDACRACQDDPICVLGLLRQIDRKPAISLWSFKKWPFLAISGIGI